MKFNSKEENPERRETSSEVLGVNMIKGVEKRIPLSRAFVSPTYWDPDDKYLGEKLSGTEARYRQEKNDFVPNKVIALGREDNAIPAQFFLPSPETIKKIEEGLEGDELLRTCIEDSESSPEPEFTENAPNILNRLYYSMPIEKHGDEKKKSATFIANNRPLNLVIGLEVLSKLPDRKELNLEEWCSGPSANRWKYISEEIKVPARVRLTDFSEGSLAGNLDEVKSEAANFEFERDKYNLLEPMEELPQEDKLDVITIGYGFDSIWFNEDKFYVKHGNDWYRGKYRLKVDHDNPKKDKIIESLKDGVAREGVIPEDLSDVFFEIAFEDINIDEVPYGGVIQQAVQNEPLARFLFPGGLVSRVKEAFDKRLKEDGVFIITDVTTRSLTRIEEGGDNEFFGRVKLSDLPTLEVTGKAGRYKIEDYEFAQKVLESEGYEVELMSLWDLMRNHYEGKYDDFLEKAEDDRRYKDMTVMIIRKK